MDKKVKIDYDTLEEVAETLRVMAHPIRLSIIELLYQNEELSVTQTHSELNIEQAIASHHLRILKGKKVVKVRRDGQHSFYSLQDREYYQILKLMSTLK